MTALAWQEAQGGEPIDNDTAETLDVFYAAKSAEGQRARVTRNGGAGPWQVGQRVQGARSVPRSVTSS
jgi:hypothetical protein